MTLDGKNVSLYKYCYHLAIVFGSISNTGDKNVEVTVTGPEYGEKRRDEGVKGIKERKKEDKGRKLERYNSPSNFNGPFPPAQSNRSPMVKILMPWSSVAVLW
jgi:hypothetical protein